MTWHFDAGYGVPADWVRLSPGQFRNIFFAGEALTFPISGAGTVGSWEVIDHTGLTVGAGGPVTFTNGGTWTLPLTLGPGWYRVLFRRSGSPVAGWGMAQGGGMFTITRQVAGMPPRPPVGTDTAGTAGTIDAALLAFTLTGPARFDTSVSNPSYQEANMQHGLDQLDTYYKPYDTTRAKPSLMAFADGPDMADLAVAKANIGTIVNKYPRVTHFESQNEPGGNPGAWFVPVQRRFYEGVKAARSSAQVLGPCPVNIGSGGLTRIREFLTAGGGDWIDVWSFHTYNAHMGDLVLGRRAFDGWKALLTEFGQWGKPRMNTESASFFGAEFGAGQAPRQGHRTMLDLFLHEQYGVQKESWSIFYTTSHGFWDYPSFIEMDGQSVLPVVALMLTHSQELLGTAYESRLDFGTLDNQHLIGSSWRRANGTGVISLLSAGQDNAPVTLRVTGTGPTLSVVNGYGRASTVSVNDGLALVRVGTTPVYVSLPAGATAVPVERSLGHSKLVGSQASVSGGRYRLSDPAQVVNGPWRNSLYFDSGNNGDGRSVFESAASPTAETPVDFTTTFAATPIDTVIAHCPPSWQWDLSVIRDAAVQVRVNGAWQTVETIGYKPRTEEFSSTHIEGLNAWYETFDADIHRFEITFPRVTATGVRLRVREVSAGGGPTADAVTAYGAKTSAGGEITAGMGNATEPRLALQMLAAFDSGAGIAGTGKYVRRAS